MRSMSNDAPATLLRLLVLGVCAAGSAACSPYSADDVCPSIAIQPHASLDVGNALGKAGTYDVTVDADGKTETCTVTLDSVGPAQKDGEVVSSPTTRTSTTCTLVRVGGIGNDGSVDLSTVGTPASITLKVSLGGTELLNGTANPDYTPDKCGFVKPRVALKAP